MGDRAVVGLAVVSAVAGWFGYSTEPMDQPYPLPDQFWPGWRDVCEWVTPELAKQAGGVAATVLTDLIDAS